jgi:hypothetical protein
MVVTRIVSVATLGAALTLMIGVRAACAQSNLDAGKSAEQIFADTCAMCHANPHALRSAPSQQFLRQHYTTGARQAAAMSAYLEKAVKEPPPPPPAPVVIPAKSRRPAESIEIGLTNGGNDLPRPGASTAATRHDSSSFEE